jgi:hypothetical protein
MRRTMPIVLANLGAGNSEAGLPLPITLGPSRSLPSFSFEWIGAHLLVLGLSPFSVITPANRFLALQREWTAVMSTERERVPPQERLKRGRRYRAFGIALAMLAAGSMPARSAAFSPPSAYYDMNQRVVADRSLFFVYQDADSGFNHGFASGLFASPGAPYVSINSACIDDTSAPQGCSTDTTALDESHGTVFQVVFPSLTSGQYTGLNFDEPQLYYNCQTVQADCGIGYNLTGATYILFSVRSPTGITLQFGAGGQTTPFVSLSASSVYATACVAVQGLAQQVCPANAAFKLDLSGSIDLTSVHLLFAVDTNAANAPGGGVVLLDNIQYEPVPTAQATAFTLPLSTQTFGVVPLQQPSPQIPLFPFPPDQVNRNPATIYEASLTIFALLARGTPTDIADAQVIADSLVYALAHDNSGDPLPVAPDGSTGLHNAYEAGDLALLNSQGASAGQAGQIRLAGFTATNNNCGTGGYCLVEDGATGGNNAFAVLALIAAYRKTANQNYLNAALTIGNWIYQQLLDTSGTGFGGYFQGYPDQGMAKVLQLGKSTENNADIFAAFTVLAQVENSLGNLTAASTWTSRAKIAGDFVTTMFDASGSCFYPGTVPVGTTASFGIEPTGPMRGNDIVNVFDFFDANSFTWLALSQSRQYAPAIPWSSVVSCLSPFQTIVTAAGVTFGGYSLIQPTIGPQGVGVAWEFTGQAAVVIGLSGGDPTPVLNDIGTAQAEAPFGDQNGLVAATVASGDTLPPIEQCLITPFQCIPERVGIAATAWAIFAESAYNPLLTTSLLTDTHDFNGDGISDIFWRDTSGDLAVWLMNGSQVLQSAGLGTAPSTFSVVGQHDFNGDGKADVLWRDTSGNVSMWLMNGASVASAAVVSAVPSNFGLFGTGDLNGDGKGDLLWRDANTGTVSVWLMNGATVTSSAVLATVPSNWTILGDANGDILWRDSSGDVALWGVQNGQVTSSSGLGNVPSNFVVQGVGDFNGDGSIDILWRDTNTGTISIWFTNGTQVTSAGVVSAVPSSWSIAQVGDYNGDGKSDILWLDSAGDLAVWLMNGTTVISSAGVSNVGTTWQVQNLNDN